VPIVTSEVGSSEGQDGAESEPRPEPTTRVGWFRYHFDEDRWEWSDEVAKMHGYAPGTIEPTTELVLAHKHPGDRQTIAATLQHVRKSRRAFSARHRIIDAHGVTRSVIVVGDEFTNDQQQIVGTHGFYIDASPQDAASQDSLTAVLAEITETRAVIEQAKGMLMAIYGLSDDLAFDLLRWRSQHTNTKVRALAQQLVTEFSALAGGENLPARSVYDRILMTMQDRLPDGPHTGDSATV